MQTCRGWLRWTAITYVFWVPILKSTLYSWYACEVVVVLVITIVKTVLSLSKSPVKHETDQYIFWHL